MPTFVDESGDTGRVGDGGSGSFSLAGVWFPTYQDVSRFRARVGELRGELGYPKTHEFKFSNTSKTPRVRRRFFEVALGTNFRFAFSHIDKQLEAWESAETRDFHNSCATELAALLRQAYLREELARGKPLREELILDDNKDKNFLAAVSEKFRAMPSGKTAGIPLVGKVRFRDSRHDAGIQLADMVCGAKNHGFHSGRSEWHDMIQERDLENLP